MDDFSLVAILVAGVVAVLVAVDLVRRVRSGLRRRRRARNGVRGEGVVEHVGPLDPPGQTVHPFVLRYHTPAGVEHTREFDAGFDGVVPVPGWTVGVLFDPDNPDNAEIVDNPHLCGIDGSPPPERRDGAIGALQRVAYTAGLLLFGALILMFAVGGFERGFFLGDVFLPVFGTVFACFGLLSVFNGVARWRYGNELRRSPGHAVGTVTHSWSEETRGSNTSGDRVSATVYPFAVLFDLPDGRQVHRRAPVATSSTRYRPGERVDVVYATTAPTRFTVGSPTSVAFTAVVPVVIGVVFVLVGAAIAAVSVSVLG